MINAERAVNEHSLFSLIKYSIDLVEDSNGGWAGGRSKQNPRAFTNIQIFFAAWGWAGARTERSREALGPAEHSDHASSRTLTPLPRALGVTPGSYVS